MTNPAQTKRPEPVDARLLTDGLNALRGGRCVACDALTFPIRASCPHCQSRKIRPVTLATGGHLWTYAVLHAPAPGYIGPVPYALGVVELDDGLRVMSIITADDLDSLHIGDRMEFELIELGPPDQRMLTFAFCVVGKG